MAERDDTSRIQSSGSESECSALRQYIERQRSKLSQAEAVIVCLHEVLLYADGEEAVTYAEAAHAAAALMADALEGLDWVRLEPLLQELRRRARRDEHAGGLDGDRVEEPRVPYVA